MAFPSVGQWSTHVPGNHGDAFLQQWLLRWDVHGLLDQKASLFHPNIFWPARNTLFHTDTQLATAPVAGLLAAVTGWHSAFNVLYVAAWVASLAVTYATARWLGVTRAGALLSSFVFAFAAVRLGHSGQFQLLFVWFVPLTLLLLVRFCEEHRWWQMVALAVVLAATLYNVAYMVVAVVPALAIVAGGHVLTTRFQPGRRFYAGLLLVAVVALVLSGPVLAGYWSASDVIRSSYGPELAATPRDFLAPADGSLLYGWLGRRIGAPYENRLFPGFLAAALGVVGGVTLLRSPSEGVRRREVLLLVLATVPALLFAFGEYQIVGGRRLSLPYSLVADLPGFRSIRAFGRFTVVPLLGLALLAGAGFDRVSRGWRTAVRRSAAAALGAAMLLEYKAAVPMAERVDRPENVAVNRTLSRLPPGPVLELPMGDPRQVGWAYVEAPRMVLSTVDWNPRVNGYSGYAPLDYPRTVDTFNSLAEGGAGPEVLALLDRLEIRYVVIRLAPVGRGPAGLGA